MAITAELLNRVQDTQTLIVALPVLALCAFIYIYTYDSKYSGLPRIGQQKGWTHKNSKNYFLGNAKKVMFEEGLKLGKAFTVVAPEGPQIVLPSSYLEEVKNDKRLSFKKFVAKALYSDYPGFTATKAVIDTTIFQDIVRVNLTQSLNLITDDLCEETDYATSKIFGESKEWTSISLASEFPKYVARMSTRVFLGSELAKREDWITVAVNYTLDLANASRVLRLWPQMLQPYVHWFLPECKQLRARHAEGHRIVNAEVKSRKALWEEDKKAGRKPRKTADSLAWMLESAEKQNAKDFDAADCQLGLTFAAIHTTTDMISKAMIRLVANPELIDTLREEIVTVLRAEGAFTKPALYKMKLLDSFLKEVQRTSPIALTPMNRVAETRVVLKDGTVIPKGADVKILADALWFSDKFSSPETFDPHRFLKMRQVPGQENSSQFVSTSVEHHAFGHGMHACPGRFFASNEIKIAFVWMLLKYDWKTDGEAGEPIIFYYGGEIISLPTNKVMMKKREAELDLGELYQHSQD